jgi:transposase
MKQQHSWEITDTFWEKAEPLVPHKERESTKTYRRKPGGGRPAMQPRKVLQAIFYVLRTGIHMEGDTQNIWSGRLHTPVFPVPV